MQLLITAQRIRPASGDDRQSDIEAQHCSCQPGPALCTDLCFGLCCQLTSLQCTAALLFVYVLQSCFEERQKRKCLRLWDQPLAQYGAGAQEDTCAFGAAGGAGRRMCSAGAMPALTSQPCVLASTF